MALDDPLSAENMVPDPITPDDPCRDLVALKTYLLKRRRMQIKVILYSDDKETIDTIQKFLDYCRDTGWHIEEQP